MITTFTGWLAVFSQLILYLAPTISQIRVADHGHCSMSAMSQTAMAKLPSLPNCLAGQATETSMHLKVDAHFQQHSPNNVNSVLETDTACGYCQLLIHIPFITFCTLVLLLLLLRLMRQLSVIFAFKTYIFRLWTRPSVRAPPRDYRLLVYLNH